MPPKKDNKKQPQAKPDHSGIPKRDVEFKITFTIRSEASQPPPLALMFEWFAGISDKFQRSETPMLDSWKKQEQTYTFQKDCDLIRVDDDFCKNISSKRFFIYFVNGEDSKVEDQLMVDFSALLTARNPSQFYFQSNIIRALGVDSFSIRITADKPLLEDLYVHYLNPLEVQVIGAKDLPIEKSNRYQPAYVKFGFFDGTSASTPCLVGSDKLLWAHKHVFLAGLMNPTELKEKMRSRYLKFEVHDRDQVANRKAKPDVQLFDIGKAILEELEKQKPVEDDPKKKGAKKEEKKEAPKKDAKKDPKKKDAKLGEPVLPQALEYQRNNYGVAAFSLVQFLKSTTRSARYKAPLVPRNAYEDLQSKNLDLNTTARNEMQGKVIASNNYFDCDTVLVVGFTLAHAIGTFKLPEAVQQQTVEDPKKKKDSKEVVPEKKQEPSNKELKPEDVLERVVFVVPYKDPETVRKIQDIFYEANQKAFGLKNRRELTTHLLKSQEQTSTQLDFISGMQICDPEGRLYMLEGLREGAMKEYGQKILRQAPNSKQFKIIKNTKIGYSNRLFGCFHLELKRIRFRPSLSQLLLSPSIYIKSKVAEQLSQTLVRLADARKIPDSLLTLDSLNLWPNAEALLQLQRKFSQPLSTQDIVGCEQQVKKDRGKSTDMNKAIRLLENTEVNVFTTDSFFQPKKIQIEENTQYSPQATKRRMAMTKTFTKDDFHKPEKYQMRGRRVEVPPGQEVYIYGGQKLNIYEKQMAEFRDKMEPNAVYTYDKNFFKLNIDPRTQYQEGRKELEMSQSKMYSKDKFSNVLIKTKDERMKLANKPGDQDILDLINYPYHQQQTHTKQILKNTRDQPTHSGQSEFQKYLRPKEIFSGLQPVEGQKLSPVEQEKLDREKRAREKEAQSALLKGSHVMAFKRGYFGEQSYGVDRFKDIREGNAKKLGFIDKHKKDGEKRPVEAYEVSYNLLQKTGDPAFNPLVRRDDPTQNVIKDEFNFYQRPEVLTRTQIYKPLKDII